MDTNRIVSRYLDSIKLNPELWQSNDAKDLRDFVQHGKKNPQLFPSIADSHKDTTIDTTEESTTQDDDPTVKAFFQKLKRNR